MSTGRDDDALRWDGDDDPTLDVGDDAALGWEDEADSPAAPPADAAPRRSVAPEAVPALDAASRRPAAPEAVPAPDAAPNRSADHAAPRTADTPDDLGGDPTEDDAPGLGNVALVAMGMIAMAYVLFAVGWFLAGLRLQGVTGLPVPGGTLVALSSAAAAAPLVWLGTVLALTRHARSWVRFAWLIAGLVLLVPWPFVLTGAVA